MSWGISSISPGAMRPRSLQAILAILGFPIVTLNKAFLCGVLHRVINTKSGEELKMLEPKDRTQLQKVWHLA